MTNIPPPICNKKPLERICNNCHYWKLSDVTRRDEYGKWEGNCFLNQIIVPRKNLDCACKEFEPKC
jgi:hypothetical protein